MNNTTPENIAEIKLQNDLLMHKIHAAKLYVKTRHLERALHDLQCRFDILQAKTGKRERELLKRLWKLQSNMNNEPSVDE